MNATAAATRRDPAMRSKRVAWLDRRLYPGLHGHWDDEIFRERVLAVLLPEHRLLDLGAGAGIVREMDFRGRCARACGVDLDRRVLENRNLDEARVADGESIPYPDASFDVVVADNVLEHLEHPARVFAEIARVLRPGGVFLAKTPNRRHYMPLIARWTPHWFHRAVNRNRGRDDADTFRTVYGANTPRRIAELARDAGLAVRRVESHERRPEYLRLSAPTYVCGWLYERAVNALPLGELFRVVLIAALEKPREAS